MALVSEKLREAQNTLHELGWMRFSWGSKRGPVCGGAALNLATIKVCNHHDPFALSFNERAIRVKCWSLIAQTITDQYPEMAEWYRTYVLTDDQLTKDIDVVTDWNDGSCESIDDWDVIFEKAIIKAEEEGI